MKMTKNFKKKLLKKHTINGYVYAEKNMINLKIICGM